MTPALEFVIEKPLVLPNGNVVAVGRTVRGALRAGDLVELVRGSHRVQAKALWIERPNKIPLAMATEGLGTVCVTLQGIGHGDIAAGDRLECPCRNTPPDHSISESEKPLRVSRAQEELDAVSGGVAKVWHFRFRQSCLVVRLESPNSDTQRTYLDCIACSRVSFSPSWEPAKIVVQFRSDVPSAPILVSDSDHLYVECQEIALDRVDDRAEFGRLPSTTGLGSPIELLDRLRKGPLLRTKSFAVLESFLHGYSCALDDHRIQWNDGTPSFYTFQEWVKEQLGMEALSLDGMTAIKTTFTDDRVAFERLFELLDTFRASSGRETEE